MIQDKIAVSFLSHLTVIANWGFGKIMRICRSWHQNSLVLAIKGCWHPDFNTEIWMVINGAL